MSKNKQSAPRVSVQRILVVDDSGRDIRRIASALTTEYEVVTAPNGRKALEMAAATKPDLMVFLDIAMPGMDGFDRPPSPRHGNGPRHSDYFPLRH